MNLAVTVPEDLDVAKPTYENLVKHVDKFGLDREAKGYNAGKPKTYGSYKQFRSDSAVEVARSYLGQTAYVAFVERFGQHSWADDARADWEEEHGD